MDTNFEAAETTAKNNNCDSLAVPLNTCWTFWIDKTERGKTAAEYEASIQKVYTVSTAQTFWAVFNNIPNVEELKMKYSYHLMRGERRPVWEDELNHKGGSWHFKVNKQDSRTVWKELLLAAIGEQFVGSVDKGDDVCGVSITVREKDDIILVWNSDASANTDGIRQKVHKLLPNVQFIIEFYKGKKHKAYVNMKKNSFLMTNFVKGEPSKQMEETKNTSEIKKKNILDTSDISNYFTGKEVQNAEILWALKCIKSHYSYKSSEDISKLFSLMFPDSKIASQFSCGEKKMAYLCCFGIAPHFQKIILKCFDESEHYVISFDETLNQLKHEKQMDIYVKFWHNSLNEVCTRYYTSVFMGHATAQDILKAFYESTNELDLRKIIQISMDGPAVNWAFYDMLQNEILKNYGSQILNVGSCSLHIVNNSFKKGELETDWDVSDVLSSLYYLFKDSPARRDDFLSSSKQKKFPLKFAAHRWLENVPCAERALEIWPDIMHYIECVKRGTFKVKNPPKSFIIVMNACKDLLMPLKLNFFLSVAKNLSPFLTLYQTEKPLLPFISTDIMNLFKQCMIMYNLLKSDKLKSLSTVTSVCKFNFDDKTVFSPISDINVGFACEKLISELKKEKKISEQDILSFKFNCQKFVIKMLYSIVEKCPINYSFVRSLMCLDPRLMARNENTCLTKMQKVLEKLAECSKFKVDECERIMLQYRTFLSNEIKLNKNEFSSFSVINMRLDAFLGKYLIARQEYNDLWRAVKSLLVMSHGQAAVERGFSLNKKIEVENLSSNTYISQKIIYDQILFCGGIENIKISKELRDSVSSARQKYMDYLERQRTAKQNETIACKKRKVEDEFNVLAAKKFKLEKEIMDLESNADTLAEEAEALEDMQRFLKSNDLRKQV